MNRFRLMFFHPAPYMLCAAIGLGSGACRDSATAPAIRCAEPVALAVGPGTRPSVSWTPDCGVGAVTVFLKQPDGIFGPAWDVSANATSAIVPPIVYGAVPAGTTAAFPGLAPDSLTPGETYTARVVSATGAVLGELTFVR